jgi:hypothetical protein
MDCRRQWELLVNSRWVDCWSPKFAELTFVQRFTQ